MSTVQYVSGATEAISDALLPGETGVDRDASDINPVGPLGMPHVDGQDQRSGPLPASSGLDATGLGYTLPNGTVLLQDVDLGGTRGTLTAVIGPSGAGKSTLSRILAGVVRPSAGSVRFDKVDVHDDYEAVRSSIGLVPQDDVLHRQLTVRTALEYAARLRLPDQAGGSTRSEQVTRVIDGLGLSGHEATRIDRLSGGQRKRASVAMELLTEPSLLVLDEPTSGLDPALDRQVMLTLRELADGGRAVVVITHSVAFLDICDQVLVLAPGGRPAYLGPTAGLTDHFGTEDWADIFESVTADPGAAHRSFRDRNAPSAPSNRSRLRRRRRGAAGPSWIRQFVALVARQVDLVRADTAYLLFLSALPVALGLLALVVPGDAGFTAPDPTDASTSGEPGQLLALLMVGASFMGASVSVRDLVGERAIFLRERAAGLPVTAYLLSKVLVFGAISWFSSAVLLGIVLLGKPAPETFLVLPIPMLELFLAVGLTASTSMIIGLLISAAVRSGEQAMPLLIVFAMSQLVLHGGIVPVTGREVLDQLSWLVPARWGFSAAAAGTDLNTLVPSLDRDWMWEHTDATWFLAVGVLLGTSLVFAVLAVVRLRRSELRHS